MSRPSRTIAKGFMLRLPATGALLAVVAAGTASNAAGDAISVPAVGLRSDQGQVVCTLYGSADGFPAKPEKAVARQFVKISSKSAACFFDNVQPGSYAITVMHDENGNGKLDKNFLGMPTEGYGASRDARGRMGPPKWEDAVFQFAGGSLQMPVTIHY
jgi:uncharacterized protein (DUF2141 family)